MTTQRKKFLDSLDAPQQVKKTRAVLRAEAKALRESKTVSTPAVTLSAPKTVDAQDKRAENLAKIKAAAKAVAPTAKVTRAPKERRKLPVATGSRIPTEDRKIQLLDGALKACTKGGYSVATRDELAAGSGVTGALMTRYFGSVDGLKDALVARAVEVGNIKIIAEALVHKHKATRKLSPGAKSQVQTLLFG